MNEQQIKDQLREKGGEDGRISCTEARKMAEAAGIDYARIGSLCDELGIRVYSCELGCF